jgi:biopolymer transport protein ExbB/TolQ
MTGFGWMLLFVSLAAIYALWLVGYRLLLSAKKLNKEIAKSKDLIAELNSAETAMPDRAEANTGADLLSLLGQRRRNGLAKEQRAKYRRRRLINRIKEIDIEKR